jgi:hypothetical protein
MHHLTLALMLMGFIFAKLEGYAPLPPSYSEPNQPYEYIPSPQVNPYGAPWQSLPAYPPPPEPYYSRSDVTNPLEDVDIAARVRYALYNDPSLLPSSRAVLVTVLNRRIVLQGVVESAAERSKVEYTVKQVQGVRSVKNRLTYTGSYY